MAANPNWARWVFASVATHLKQVAIDNDLPVYVEHSDDRTPAFNNATDRAEIRITGPYVREESKDCFKLQVAVNVLLNSRYDTGKNAYSVLKYAGDFQAALSDVIPVWNYGNEPGDYQEDDPQTQVFIGCLLPKNGKNDSVRVDHFGQLEETSRIKQTLVDASFYMFL